MEFLLQTSPALLFIVAILVGVGIGEILCWLMIFIVRFAKRRERKVQEFRDQIDTAQKILLAVPREQHDCQEQVARLNTYKDVLERTIRRLDAEIGLKLKIYRKYGENIQDLAQKVEDLEAAIKEKEDKIRKAIIVEIEIGSEKRRVSI